MLIVQHSAGVLTHELMVGNMLFILLFWLSFLSISYTYIGYYFMLKTIVKYKKSQRRFDDTYQPSFSMIVAAFNEEKVIEQKIENFLNLRYSKEKMELIIGSDGSTDRTNEILDNLDSIIIKVKLYTHRRGKASVLNDLVKLASGDILVFSDANTMYERSAVKRLVRHFVEPQVGGVCGRLILDSADKNIGGKGEILYWDYENELKRLESRIRTIFGANGAIYAIHKNLYKSLPTDVVIMDDFLIALRIVESGYDVIFDEQAVGREAAALDEKGEFNRKIRIGAANFNSLRWIKPLLNPKRGFISYGLWSHKILRWFVPFFMLMLLISNLFLFAYPLYIGSLIAQGMFYSCVLVGWILSMLSRKVHVFSYFYYFFLVNLGLLIGFIKFLLGTQKPAWSRTER